MQFKTKEMEEGFKNPGNFPPAMHFFKAQSEIEKSMVFSIIKQMPKGAALHLHDVAVATPVWIVKNVTYKDHLYTRLDGKIWTFMFSDPPPQDQTWQSVKTLRLNSPSAEKFDEWLESLFSLYTDDPHVAYPDLNAVWRAFDSIFGSLFPLLTFRPVFEEYLYELLNSFRRDNVFYIEMRGVLPALYELNGDQITDPKELLKIMYDVNQQFIHDHPEFLGMKFIYGNVRSVNSTVVSDYIKTFKEIHALYPDFVVGFDLVGQEDMGSPLIDFVDELQIYKDDIKYFFHAGETNWNGMSTDLNILDAILLNTHRIGHGYALSKHPKMMEEVKSRNIAIEVNPISNQVLMLVSDLRNHPAQILISMDYPVVISCDDPGFWKASGLSYDFYEAFMGMASSSADLKMLKQLVLNSIEYSAMSEDEKSNALALWNKDWAVFVDNVTKQYDNLPDLQTNNVCRAKCSGRK